MMPARFRHRPQRFLLPLLALFTLSLASGAAAREPQMLWEKIHVAHLLPSVLFANLGLTHITKNGHTRDGKHGVPDPTFPAGLTDVVPYDADHLLLVRGTSTGRSVFRQRVQNADVIPPPLHLHAELSRRQANGETPLSTEDQDSILDGHAAEISLGDGSEARVYQIKTRQNADGTLWVACRVSLPLPVPAAGDAPATAIFVPQRVWTDPQSRKLRPGEVAVFADQAAVREAAAVRLGATGPDTRDDYTLRVTMTAMPAPPNTP